jgi:hypothetical protein
VLPVRAGPNRLLESEVGLGEPIVGPGLIVGLAESDGEGECLIVMRKGSVWVAGGLLYSAKTLPRFNLTGAVAILTGEVEQPTIIVGGLLVPTLPSVHPTQTSQRGPLAGTMTDGAGQPQRPLK